MSVTPKITRKPYGKPLFSGLDYDDKSSAQEYSEHFYREQYTESANAHLKTPPTPPQFRELPAHNPAARSKYDTPKADARLTMTRSSKGVRNSVGTTSVPAGLRKSAGEKLRPKAKDGRRKTRAASATRAKSAEKIVYNGRVGMTAKPAPLTHGEIVLAQKITAMATLVKRDLDAEHARMDARTDAKAALRDAIGRERAALARNDEKAAQEARSDIRKFRKAAQFKKGA